MLGPLEPSELQRLTGTVRCPPQQASRKNLQAQSVTLAGEGFRAVGHCRVQG